MADHTELAVDRLLATEGVSDLQERLTVSAADRVDLAAQRSAAGEDESERRRRITPYLVELSARLRTELPKANVAGVDYELRFRNKYGTDSHPSLFANGEELLDMNAFERTMWWALGKQSSLPAYRDALVAGGIRRLSTWEIDRAFRHRTAEERSFGIHYMEVIDAFTEIARNLVDPAGRRLAVELRAALATADLPTTMPATKLTPEQVDALSRVTERDLSLEERLDILETLCQVVHGDRILIKTAIEEFARLGSLVSTSYAGFRFKDGNDGLKVKRRRVVLIGVPFRRVNHTLERGWDKNRNVSIPLPLEHRANRGQTHASLRRMLGAAPRLLTDTRKVASENGSLRAANRAAVDPSVQR
jgi:hypothetical protein